MQPCRCKAPVSSVSPQHSNLQILVFTNESYFLKAQRLSAKMAPNSNMLALQRLFEIKKARHWRAFSTQNGSYLPSTHWMAGAAVGFEPDSSMDCLLTGNFTGNIAISGSKTEIPWEKPLGRSDFSSNSLCERTGKNS